MNRVSNTSSILALNKLMETLSALVFLSPPSDVLIYKGCNFIFSMFYVVKIM